VFKGESDRAIGLRVRPRDRRRNACERWRLNSPW
jgi:hypothetical protein